MSADVIFYCPDCRMGFQSSGLLQKHQSRFCVGSPTHEPVREYQRPPSEDYNILQQAFRQESPGSGSEDSEDSERPRDMDTPQSDLWARRSHQLRLLKTKVDHRPPPAPAAQPGISPTPRTHRTNNNHWSTPPSTGSSMSIHLPPSTPEEDDPIRPNLERENRQRQLRVQAEHHSKNLAQYKSKSKSLEMQKNEIDRRLRHLNQDIPASMSGLVTNGTTYQLWQELQQQEDRNTHSLSKLKKQMHDIGKSRPLTSETSLYAEVSALRRAYLQQGGNNPALLSSIAELEVEAASAEAAPEISSRRHKKHKERYDTLSDQVLAFDRENKHLENELLDLQDKNNDYLDHTKSNKEESDDLAFELYVKQREYMSKLADLESEIELLKKQAKLDRLKKTMERERERDREQRSPTPVPPPPPQPPARQLVPYDSADVPALLLPNKPERTDIGGLEPAPYDPTGGFMVFYDFVSDLDPDIEAVRLVVGLYNNTAQYGQPTVLPTVYCDDTAGYNTSATALISAKQPVPRCPPGPDLGLVIELQVGSTGVGHYQPGRLVTRGWCKVDLFDPAHRLYSGRWRIPLRVPPIKPNYTTAELNNIPQYGVAEIYMRLVNDRDAEGQAILSVTPQNAQRYTYPPQTGPQYLPQSNRYYPPQGSQPFVPPPPSSPPPSSAISARNAYRDSRAEGDDVGWENVILGFQVDRVKGAESGEAKVRLTAYYRGSGKVVQSDTSPVTCSTVAVKSNFRYKYHVFGQQEAVFHNVQLKPDVLVVLRLYLRRKVERELDDSLVGPQQDPRVYDDETLAAWATLPLMVNRHGDVNDRGPNAALSDLRINTGTHTVQLYRLPVPEPDMIPMETHHRAKPWDRYGKATARLHIFVNKPRSGSLTPSEASDDDQVEEMCPDVAWIPKENTSEPSIPYTATDGFDLYIDGCRNLPDVVTVTRVAARILDRQYQKVSKDINTSVKLDSDIYNPLYEYRTEVREPHMPPSSTLLLKVYSLEKFNRNLIVAGYAILNIFVEVGSQRQPSTDTGGTQVALNEGCHQLRLYERGPSGVEALTESYLRDLGVRHVPCATILIRIHRAPIGPQGRPLEADKVPRVDWVRMGLFHPRPAYSEGLYFSDKCKPTKGECRLFHALLARPRVSMREAITMIADQKDLRALKTDRNMETFIRSLLTKLMDMVPTDIDVAFIAQYNPKYGIKFAIDGALNLPWSNFTHASYCLNPPGAFYMGHPNAAYDKLCFTEKLDLDSTNRNPCWRDGFKHFPSRSYNRYLTMVVHLQEVGVSVATDSYKYSLLDQAWTAVPVFSDKYANTCVFQLPLFHGAPSEYMLNQMAREPLLDWMKRNYVNPTMKLVDGACVFVRMSDGRRDDELPIDLLDRQLRNINTKYLPERRLGDYTKDMAGKPFIQLVPPGKSPNEFISGLATKYKSLVYKLYEENKIGDR